MGLDASLYSAPKEYENVSFINPKDSFSDSEFEELHYWRKFWGLQYWMERLYQKKGGTEEFNCVYLQLTKDDLNQLKKNCKNFCIDSCMFPDDIKNLRLVIDKAIKIIDNGKCVFYWCWY